jgi:predicted small metal-binding protein
MFAGKALRCDCGYEVRGNNEDELVEAIQRHALEAHHIEFTLELAREVNHFERLSQRSQPRGLGGTKARFASAEAGAA